jgi:hypothetical protein
MLKRLFKASSVGCVTFLVACQGLPSSLEVAPRAQYVDTAFSNAVNKGAMFLETIGEPFVMDIAAFQAAVAKGLVDGAIHNPPARFTFAASHSPTPDYRTVILFNPPQNVEAKHVCLGASQISKPSSDELTMLSVFCHRTEVMSAILGWVKQPKNGDDPSFQHLLRQVGRDLYDAPQDSSIGGKRNQGFD